MDTAKVQIVTKSSSDELLRKFAEVGSSESDQKAAGARRELRLSKRRKRVCAAAGENGGCESPSNCGNVVVERRSLLPPASRRSSAALIRRLGIGRARTRAKDFRNKSFFGTIEKTWHKTIEGASKVFMEKHYNRHKRLINDAA